MDGAGAPFDEEREKAMAVVCEMDGFPIEDAAVGPFSGAVLRPLECDLIVTQEFCGGRDVKRMDGPTDEARIFHLADLREVDDFLLGGIRRDNFQVTALAERKQGVARAAAGMGSADGGS